MATIKVNDKPQEVRDNTNLADLLALNNILQPDMVSVQLNGEFVLRENYNTTVLADGDEIDFLYFMGGGGQLKIKNYETTFDVSQLRINDGI